ncbi:MAG TPA: helix-turn-helix domain-containing protein, partial [Chloroflexota bacterium]|nr:helix-turn-helix domain-containing protein [Chloroflexota bacterium]
MNSKLTAPATATLSVAEAAELLGRHRTRIYALGRSGDLVARPGSGAGDDEAALRIDRSSVERWAVAGGQPRLPAHAAQRLGDHGPGQWRSRSFRALHRVARAARGGFSSLGAAGPPR